MVQHEYKKNEPIGFRGRGLNDSISPRVPADWLRSIEMPYRGLINHYHYYFWGSFPIVTTEHT